MMLGTVVGSLISGQILSRKGGHYRIQGAAGLAIMIGGLALLTQIKVDTRYASAVTNLMITGFEQGITIPLYTIAAQNAVPYSQLGVATSSTSFFRSIGGSVGLAIFGSVMNNRFFCELMGNLPAAFKAMVAPPQLGALVSNPQALMSPEAQSQLQLIIQQVEPQGSTLFHNVLLALRQALDVALSEVFLLAMVVEIIAFVVNFFIRKIPLRRQHATAFKPAELVD